MIKIPFNESLFSKKLIYIKDLYDQEGYTITHDTLVLVKNNVYS